ncbi:MAG: hypothetical protein A3H51_00500 [Candidatus Spechtbacteria bacterium RIFCSPLOWO2_02_FULL_38_8]|uniref:Type 4 fimbrial biogenesis protein PilX N-terminal domain-containing protein n=1 Tax=Candidatus Spechtbacteria bacterium RIFCSPLOWO2_02_FULL_38_8 TaxID=1802164 RepID=A0A1G2HKD3_9BACT|nr:MAG: hypothetical protein A3H51_00500 [Candidatus Spechtbacteria bacterium RIFCSPLOWO2_02_FULL_38_8]
MFHVIKLKLKNQSGVSLYLSVLVLAAVLAIGFGIASLLLGQLKTSRDIQKLMSVIYASDAGVERTLYKIRQNGDFTTCSTLGPPAECEIPTTLLQNQASYKVIVLDPGVGWCDLSKIKCIRSIGTLEDTNRAFEVTF